MLPAYSLTSAGQRNSSDQLAAISFTAVVDYNTRMHQDQTLTLGQLQRDFQLMREVGLRYEGKEIKSLGYGLVMAFASAERAVTWAIEVQRALAVQTARLDQEDNLEHRIGIHLGDVEFRDGDVMGDVVNIAARLQPLAAPGGVCLSQAVYDAVMSGLQVSVEDGGLQNLKGIPHPVRVYDIPPPPPVTITRRKVFISYRAKEPDLGLAREFHHALTAAGHEVFMAGESIRPGEDWVQRIDAELQQCDYLLLLLSEKAVASEMVTEEVRRAKGLRDLSPDRKPVILPIRVSFPRTAPLNYDLRGFLNRIQQREWESSEDTPALLEEYLDLIERGALLESVEGSELTLTPVVERSDLPPLPVAEPELPGGQMDVASAFYVVREPIESFCYREITKNGALIRIKAPRQMGKTSLMAHILYQAKQQTYRTIPLTFQLTDEAVFTDLNQFLRRFCALVSRKLGIPLKQLDEYWDDQYFGPKDNCTEFFEQCILANLETPLVLALDEVDQVFVNHRVAKEFLTLLRAWNEQAKVSDIWAQLRLVLVHSTEVYIVMDTNSSPFNVGLPIELPEFTPEQVADLADRHGLIWTPTQIQQLMAMIGGHPYLVRVAMYYVARGDVNFAELLQMAATEAGLYGDHLRRHLWNLEQHKDLATAMAQVVASEIPVRLDAEQAFKLHGMGLVQLHQNKVTPRYDMYRLYFRDRLGG
ncbi:molecular chaperone Tir [Leptolyngbya sp. 'hensonii']|nr:molecular chaperone Tir [Leptolyngbya sp. 'hensonii']